MKKLSLHLLLFSLIVLCGCTGEDEPSGPILDGERLHEVELAFNLRVDPASSTRASRPLESMDCWQHVTDVKIYVFRSDSGAEGSFYYYYPAVKSPVTDNISRQPYFSVDDFYKTDGDNWADHVQGNEAHTYSVIPLLGEGYYRFLAVGRDDDPSTSPLTISWKAGETEWSQALMENEAGHPRVTEIFSGYPVQPGTADVKTLRLPGEKAFKETITLRRAVAGVLLNVKNIPVRLKSEFSWYSIDQPTGVIHQDLEKNQEYDVHEVAIVCAGYYPTLDLVSRRWHDPKPFQPDASRFFATRLAWVSTKGLTAETTEHGNLVYPQTLYNGHFTFPVELVGRDFYADYYGGEKEDPANLTKFDKSLYLCFYTISRSGAYYPLKMIPIKIVRSNIHDPGAHDNCAGDDVLDPTGTHFNLVANHLYCLGTRMIDEPEDKPIDLDDALHHPELEITVLGAWQVDVDIDMDF